MNEFSKFRYSSSADEEKVIKSLRNRISEQSVFKDAIDFKERFSKMKSTGKIISEEDKKEAALLIKEMKAKGYSIKEISQHLEISRPRVYYYLNFT